MHALGKIGDIGDNVIPSQAVDPLIHPNNRTRSECISTHLGMAVAETVRETRWQF